VLWDKMGIIVQFATNATVGKGYGLSVCVAMIA
jgi:hypothetical protein